VGLLFSPIAPPERAVAADDAAATVTDAAKESLNRLLAGATPMGVADLKAIQTHVRSLTDQLMKCTVGVQVGRAQGSGVIISKDGYVLTAAHVAGNNRGHFLFADGKTRWQDPGLNRTRRRITKIATRPTCLRRDGSSDNLKGTMPGDGYPAGIRRPQASIALGRVPLGRSDYDRLHARRGDSGDLLTCKGR
jgi:hypothetical protein